MTMIDIIENFIDKELTQKEFLDDVLSENEFFMKGHGKEQLYKLKLINNEKLSLLYQIKKEMDDKGMDISEINEMPDVNAIIDNLSKGSYLHKTGCFGTLVYYKNFNSLLNVDVTDRQQSDETGLEFLQRVVNEKRT